MGPIDELKDYFELRLELNRPNTGLLDQDRWLASTLSLNFLLGLLAEVREVVESSTVRQLGGQRAVDERPLELRLAP